jgi:hypothetical protein
MRPAFSAARDIGLSLFCTTRFENAHRGPFFARFFIGIIPGLVARICIHGAVDKDGFVVFRCTLEESQATVTNERRGRGEQMEDRGLRRSWPPARPKMVAPHPGRSLSMMPGCLRQGTQRCRAVLAMSTSVSLLKPAMPTAPTTSPAIHIGMPPRSTAMSAVTNAVRPG